jgi:carboxypeptidase PM20D1
MEESLEILRKTAAKYELSMDIVEARDFTRAANIKSDAYQLFLRAIDETFPGIVSIPYVMVGASDARFYQDICDTVVRFAPVIYGPEQMDGIHGINENIETVCLPGCVDFYKNLICAL